MPRDLPILLHDLVADPPPASHVDLPTVLRSGHRRAKRRRGLRIGMAAIGLVATAGAVVGVVGVVSDRTALPAGGQSAGNPSLEAEPAAGARTTALSKSAAESYLRAEVASVVPQGRWTPQPGGSTS